MGSVRRPRGGAPVAGVLLVSSGLLMAACSSGGASASASSRSSTPASSGPSPSASASVDPVASCARSLVDGLDPAGRAGQLVMVGVPAAKAAQGVALVRQLRLGGVFLAGRGSIGVTATRGAVDILQAAALTATGMRLQVATDQEGGQVQVLSGPGFSPIPDAVHQGSWSAAVLRSRWRVWAGQLVSAGVTLDLAPVADTVAAADRHRNPPIGRYDRQYGGDSDDVAAAVSTVVRAMLSARLGSTVKHFPGLGRVRANTDTSAAAVDPVTGPGDPNLVPFATAISAGTTAVMVSTARYPRLDKAHPAAFSPAIVTGLLRGTMAYEGVVISDDLGKAVAVQSWTPGQRAVQFVGAGGDIVLTVVAADAAPMVQALVAQSAQDASFAGLVDSAVYRVVLAKVRAGLASCS